MLQFLFFLPALVIAKCPLNWIQYEKQCYFYSSVVASWSAAEQICQVRGGHLASIHSRAQNNWMILNVIKNHTVGSGFSPTAYLGGYWNATIKAWLWTDGSPLNFTHFDKADTPAIISDSDTDPYSIRIYSDAIYNNIGQWLYMENRLNYAEGFICQVPVCDANGRSAASILSQNTTDLWLAYLPSANAWFYGCPGCLANIYTNQEAENNCQSIGAHLPSVHNAYQNNELLAAMAKISKQEYHDYGDYDFQFGLVSNATGLDWKFSDGTPLTYTNWAHNQPQKFSHTAYSNIYIDGWYTAYKFTGDYGCQINLNANLCQ